MVRNAYGMAVYEKIIDFSREKSMNMMKKCLNWAEKKDGEAASIPLSRIF